jgi:sulfhydrogenase subunit delta
MTPRVAVFKMASCDGCQLQLLDAEDALLALADAVEIVNFAEASSHIEPGPYDVTMIEGSVSTPEQIEQVKEIRAQSRFLITIGACATSGGVQALRNGRDIDEIVRSVYATPAFISPSTWSSPAVRSIGASCSARSRACCRARCRGPRPRRCASSASGAASSAWWSPRASPASAP